MVKSKKGSKARKGSVKRTPRKKIISKAFPIVAIGASAGGLEAFEQFFKDIKPCGMAYVIITHLDRDHISILPELIRKYTAIPVVTIKSGTLVEPNHIYVIPPKTNIIIKKGVLLFTKQVEPHFKNQPISLFFQSLANDQGKNAIAVVLSGSGSDGSQALNEVKDRDGIIIAQNPASAAYNSMPRAAINTGLVDYVMNPEDIFHQLKKLVASDHHDSEKSSPELLQIISMLRKHTGHDFSHYKLNTVCRRVEKQMIGHHIKSLPEYVKFLQYDKSEIDNLLKDLLIGVTRFFRDIEVFDCLKNEVLLKSLKKSPRDYNLRVWIPACSTGEEAYTVAMILYECMLELDTSFNIQILATDIDVHALTVARTGIYPETIEADVTPDRLKRFFTKEGDRYKIKSTIRSKVIFGEQNIIKDPPFTRLDLICCRNLLIYLDSKLQAKVLPLLHYSLNPNGILLLGMSEAATSFSEYFELISKKCKIFRRKDANSSPRAIIGFDVMPRHIETPYLGDISQKDSGKLSVKQTIQEFILDNYTSPCAVINKSNDVIYTHGNIENFLIGTRKKSSLNIVKDSYLDIKMSLLPLLHRVRVKKRKIINENTKVKVGKKIYVINLHVLPITHINALRDHILVIFEDSDKLGSSQLSGSTSHKKNDIKLEILIQELQNTKENLQATIEELEAGNEELQSANEELQSTNEEIETSKEEMQSLNEELVIVNTELQSKIDQLATINDDMNNLFNSTEVAAFFLDNDLRIKRFTPKAQEFMHLIQTDVGRPFSHFSTNIKEGNIVKNSIEVLRNLAQKSYEVETKEGRWYNIRILPYRTLTNNIDGVVITLTDISKAKAHETELVKLNKALTNTLTYTENLIDMTGVPMLVLNADLMILTANSHFYEAFKIRNKNINDHYLNEIKQGLFDNTELRNSLEQVATTEKPMPTMVVELNSDTLNYKQCSVNAQIIRRPESDEKLIFMRLELLNYE